MPVAPAIPCVGIRANTPAALLVASLVCQIKTLEAHAGVTCHELIAGGPRPPMTVKEKP